jgi:hypothetical protein
MLQRRIISRDRRGALVIELLFVLPVLLLLILAMVQFSLTLFARQQLVAASREGCRVAALGGDLGEVERSVHRVLGTGRLGDAEIEVTDESGTRIPSGQAIPSGEPVAVWLRLPTVHAVPDLLRFVGYSNRDDELIARTVMRRE